jgi:hypothetical protein
MTSEVLKVVKMSMLVCWVVVLCGLVGRYEHFKETNIFRDEDGDYVSLVCWYLPIIPHGITSHRTNMYLSCFQQTDPHVGPCGKSQPVLK